MQVWNVSVECNVSGSGVEWSATYIPCTQPSATAVGRLLQRLALTSSSLPCVTGQPHNHDGSEDPACPRPGAAACASTTTANIKGNATFPSPFLMSESEVCSAVQCVLKVKPLLQCRQICLFPSPSSSREDLTQQTHFKASDKSSFNISPNTHSSARHESRGGVEVQLHAFCTSAVGGREWSASRFSFSSPHDSVPNALLLTTGVSFRTSLGGSEKKKSLFFLTGIEPRFFDRHSVACSLKRLS